MTYRIIHRTRHTDTVGFSFLLLTNTIPFFSSFFLIFFLKGLVECPFKFLFRKVTPPPFRSRSRQNAHLEVTNITFKKNNLRKRFRKCSLKRVWLYEVMLTEESDSAVSRIFIRIRISPPQKSNQIQNYFSIIIKGQGGLSYKKYVRNLVTLFL